MIYQNIPHFNKINRHTRILNTLAKIASVVEPVAAARLASAIVIKNEIISIGINKNKTHTFQKRFGKNAECIYFHSETNAIYNALKNISINDLQKSYLYIARVKKDNKGEFHWGLAKSCNGCYHCAEHFGIKRIFYTTNEGTYEEI